MGDDDDGFESRKMVDDESEKKRLGELKHHVFLSFPFFFKFF